MSEAAEYPTPTFTAVVKPIAVSKFDWVARITQSGGRHGLLERFQLHEAIPMGRLVRRIRIRAKLQLKHTAKGGSGCGQRRVLKAFQKFSKAIHGVLLVTR
jgi:hypothetical protein